jgi:thiamine biosynthesis protein ThiI
LAWVGGWVVRKFLAIAKNLLNRYFLISPMKGLLLLSGGFDSPVGGALIKKKGVAIVAIHFSGQPFINDQAEKKSIKLAKLIGCEKIIIFPFGKILGEIVRSCKHRFYFIISKRIMFKVAEKIAKMQKFDFLITGDNLGQVGSQTLTNLCLVNSSINMIILQPLLSFDKQEIIDSAKTIGTYETSCGPEMCSVLGPKHPATAAKKESIEKEEQKLNIDEMLDSGFREMHIMDLR